MLKNTTLGYGWLAILFHWLSAIIVIGLFTVGLWMVDLNYYSDWYKTAPHYHKSMGLLLATLTAARLLWKLKQPSPAPLGKSWGNISAKITHVLMYLILFSMFISGYLISTADGRGIDVFNWFQVPSLGEWFDNQEELAGWIHEILAYSLGLLVVIHAGAALKHHFISKDTILVRIFKATNK